jgi:hypothetical protein
LRLGEGRKAGCVSVQAAVYIYFVAVMARESVWKIAPAKQQSVIIRPGSEVTGQHST